MTRARITGVGSYLPERIVTNDDLAKMVDTSDAWIQERTGIKQRHFAAEGQVTSDLGFEAATKALEAAGCKATDIDLLVVATTTPDLTFPSTASIIQNKLGIPVCQSFDIQAVCSGFVYGLSTVRAFIKSGQAKRALLIGAETYSNILNFDDRTTCVLFGDGAGAAVLEAEEGDEDIAAPGLIDTAIHCASGLTDILYVNGGVSTTKTAGHLTMQGQDVFKHAVEKMGGAVKEMLAKYELGSNDIDLYVPHQANQRILNKLQQKLKIEPERMMSCMELHANTSAASIPLALDLALKQERCKPGDLIMTEALGGGITWGTALIRL